MTPAPAKHDPVYRIIFANLPSATLNPRFAFPPVDDEEEVADARLRCERAVEMGEERMLPIPRVAMKIPKRVAESLGLSSTDKLSLVMCRWFDGIHTGNRPDEPNPEA